MRWMGQFESIDIAREAFSAGEGSDDQAFYGGKCSLSVGNEY